MKKSEALVEGLIYTSSKPTEKKDLVIDFSILTDCVKFNIAFRRWLIAEVGHTSHDTQKAYFYSLRLFAKYLSGSRVQLITSELYDGFVSSLSNSARGGSAQVIARRVKLALEWCQRNVPNVIKGDASFILPRIRSWSARSESRKVPTELDMRCYLRACYEDIEQTEKILQKGGRVLSGTVLNDEEGSVSRLVCELMELGDGRIPPKTIVNRSGHAYAARISRLGGHKALANSLWLSPEALFPFYLAVLIQIGGNPRAVMTLRRDCVRPHPLRSDIERIVWEKPRATQEQISDFPVGREWSAPSLVRRLISLNNSLVNRCSKSEKCLLFICYKPTFDQVGLPSACSFHHEFRRFVVRHDLPHRELRDFRRAVAVEHHRKGRSLAEAQRKLNHVNIGTTLLYSDLSDRSSEHDAVIAHFQGEMIRLSKGRKTRAVPADATTERWADTVFGFRCLDPLGGVAPGSRKGTACSQFFRCASCPGALVPLDDPMVVARLVATREELEATQLRASREGWLNRFEMLYAPTLRILILEILPAVHQSVRERASKIDARRFIPILE